ncbi:MAG: hypothetical protein RLZZ292_2356 [Bacteroidota bacterium]|jgi:hypothetical protein
MKKCISFVVIFVAFQVFLSAQCISGDCLSGNGTFVFDSGARYVGAFTSGKMNGQGTLTFSNGDKYIGTFFEQFREGQGKFIYTNGNQYVGSFKRNRFSGDGTMLFKSGDKYIGSWANDVPNGNGKYFYADGSRYEGMLVKGIIEGAGTMYYPDGTRFVGNWLEGKRNGKGTLYDKNNKSTSGNWENDELLNGNTSSPSKATTTTNTTKPTPTTTAKKIKNCNEEYCNNCDGEFIYSDGSKFVGTFKEGYPEGTGTIQYANGDRYVGGWSRHAPNGEGIMYYATGRVAGAIWEYGKPIQELKNTNTIPQEYIEPQKSKDVKIWAVIVGVGSYAHMPALKYTDDDAYQMYAFLKSPEGGALPDAQVRVLIDEDATRDNILRAMRQVFLKADDNDVIVLYFSGHGLEGSFIPVDYDGYNNQLRHEDIKALFNESKAKHKLCIADACYSGSLLTMKSVEVDAALDKYYKAFEDTNGGISLLLSSSSQEYSLEDKGLRSGVFSYYLRKGLRGEADTNKNKIVTIKELYNYIYTNVRQYTGNMQTPELSGDYDANMPVGVVR